MTVTVDQMRSKLLPVEDVRRMLATTEPLNSIKVDEGTKFHLNNWNSDPEATKFLKTDDIVAATVDINGREYPLTKEALLQATSKIGLSKVYVTKTPSNFIEPQLNYWIANEGLQSLVSKDTVSAFTRETVRPFSNVALLDNIIEGLGDQEVLVDYKFNHSLESTNLRLVLPQRSRVLERTGTENDEWSIGIQLTNSLIGSDKTSMEGYLFRWWCTNGMISQHATSGVWSRKSNGQGDEVYGWAREAVDGILSGLGPALDEIQGLVDVPVEGQAANILHEIFTEYKIKGDQKTAILNRMVDAELNMYEIMNAVTMAANDPTLSPEQVMRLLMAGGDIPHNITTRCEACNSRLQG